VSLLIGGNQYTLNSRLSGGRLTGLRLNRGFFLSLSFLIKFVSTGFSINHDFHPHHYAGAD
jgi:hypothetical protein